QGDIVVEDGDIFGDGVNVAARLEALAEPGGICVSARVQEDAAGRLDLVFNDLGEQALKKYHPARSGLPNWAPCSWQPRGTHAHSLIGSAGSVRQAVHRGLALPEPEWRPRAGVFR